jgi:hypothetical protein
MAKKKQSGADNVRNYVAKHARQFNTAAVFTDRKKAAKRGAIKHKGRPFDVLGGGFLLSLMQSVNIRPVFTQAHQ